MDTSGLIEIAHIQNLTRQPVQIIVDEPEEDTAPILFAGSGLVYLAPGETIEVREERVNRGQLEYLFQERFIFLRYMQRDIDAVT